MNKESYEMLMERARECSDSEKKCEECGYHPNGCSRYFLLQALAEAIDGFINPQTSGVYDLEEVHENVTVEVWRNSVTGEESIGWYENGRPEDRTYAQ